MSISVALHTIGQTPRPDLTPFLISALGVPDCIITGALDGLDESDISSCTQGDFPLETRLSDGTRVEVGASFLEPLIQLHIDNNAAALHLVLCAGPFPNLTSNSTLVRPFEHACSVLKERGLSRLGIVVPFDGQATPAAIKWRAAGFEVQTFSMTDRPAHQTAAEWLIEVGSEDAFDALILDYVGYPKAILNEVSAKVSIPVIDLGYLATDFAREMIEKMNNRQQQGDSHEQ